VLARGDRKVKSSMEGVKMSTAMVSSSVPGVGSPAAPDFAAIKKRQQATWAAGDFSVVASRIVLQAEQLCESADVQAGWRVLDVATGSGNAAIAAARRGCSVVGADYVPALLERGRIRAKAEHLSVEFVEADTERLPFADGSFDAVLSIYGSMFAPNQHKAASEIARVCKPGGRIALASWTPGGFIGDTFRVFARHLPTPVGLTPPMMWGGEAHLRTLFGGAVRSVRSTVRTAVFRYQTAEENVEFFRTYYGPTLKAFESLSACGRDALAADLAALARQHDRNKSKGGPIAITAEYLETVMERA
jgi:ubiquinone/menaquinone biosynthesis C-methylase UbiE